MTVIFLLFSIICESQSSAIGLCLQHRWFQVLFPKNKLRTFLALYQFGFNLPFIILVFSNTYGAFILWRNSFVQSEKRPTTSAIYYLLLFALHGIGIWKFHFCHHSVEDVQYSQKKSCIFFFPCSLKVSQTQKHFLIWKVAANHSMHSSARLRLVQTLILPLWNIK